MRLSDCFLCQSLEHIVAPEQDNFLLAHALQLLSTASREKTTSLLPTFVIYDHKSFITLGLGLHLYLARSYIF
jgi:hypothetical protein